MEQHAPGHVDNSELANLSDAELTTRLKAAVKDEFAAQSKVLRHIGEFDKRKLWAEKGCSSMFVYCTRVLKYSEDESAKRIYAARAAEKHRLIYQLLDQRLLNLSSIVLLSSHLTEENHGKILWQAAGKTRVEVETLIAALDPEPTLLRDVVRPLTAVTPAVPQQASVAPLEPSNAASPNTEAHSVKPALVRFSFTGSGALMDKLRRAKEILRHKYPYGQLGPIVEEAVDALLDKKDMDRIANRPPKRR